MLALEQVPLEPPSSRNETPLDPSTAGANRFESFQEHTDNYAFKRPATEASYKTDIAEARSSKPEHLLE